MAKKNSRSYDFVFALLADEERRKAIESLPCTIFEVDDAFAFRFAFVDKPGVVALEFYSHGLADWALTRAKAVMRAFVADKIAGQSNSEEFLRNYPTDEQAEFFAELVALTFIKGLGGKLRSLLGELERETECYLYEVTHKLFPDGKQPPRLKSVKQLAKQIAEERKGFLEASIARFGEPQWVDMKGHYDALLPTTKKAKRIYEQNRTENWQAMIKAAFPHLDSDLILLLSNDTDDLAALPAEALKATENSEDYSKPSNIALEQAARLCGMKPFQFTPRTLRDRMNQKPPAKMTRKVISPQERKAGKLTGKKDSPHKLISGKVH